MILATNFLEKTSLPSTVIAKMVDIQAYLFYSGWNQTNPHLTYSGASLDCPINRNSPIFDDIIGDTRKIRWIGAPAYEIPENPDREIMVLAKFPEIEFSDNESTKFIIGDILADYQV